jgi:hypothetical protein
MFEKKKVQIKYSFVITFYSTDKVWRGDVLASDYQSVLKYIQKKISKTTDVEKIIIRESSGYDGRHMFGFCPDCGKQIQQEVVDE